LFIQVIVVSVVALALVAAQGLVGPVTLVLGNARYQRKAIVMGLA
jgi:hypothetical protein